MLSMTMSNEVSEEWKNACVRSSTKWVRARNGHKEGHRHFSLGGTYTKTLTWLSIILIDMHWWDLNTKYFRRVSAIHKAYRHQHNKFSLQT